MVRRVVFAVPVVLTWRRAERRWRLRSKRRPAAFSVIVTVREAPIGIVASARPITTRRWVVLRVDTATMRPPEMVSSTDTLRATWHAPAPAQRSFTPALGPFVVTEAIDAVTGPGTMLVDDAPVGEAGAAGVEAAVVATGGPLCGALPSGVLLPPPEPPPPPPPPPEDGTTIATPEGL